MISELLSVVPADKFASILIAVAEAAMDHADKKALAVSLDPISRGAQYAKETGDTSQLEIAIRDFINKRRGSS